MSALNISLPQVVQTQKLMSPDGTIKCAQCLKKNPITNCKVCVRCSSPSCKSCFKIDAKGILQSQKVLFASKEIGKCCFNDLIYQHNILSDNSIEWCKDSLVSANWCSNSYKEDFSLINPASNADTTFEDCVELSTTKYKKHAEMQLIEKEIMFDDIYGRKNMNKSLSEFLATVQHNVLPEKTKEDQLVVVRAFIVYLLESRKSSERKVREKANEEKMYFRGHGMLALFLLCFCSRKRAFFIMTEIFTQWFPDILLPDRIKLEANYTAIIRNIVFKFLENFYTKKDTTPELIEKLVSFSRKYLHHQYNYFFLNTLNFSAAYFILEQLFEHRTHEVLTKAMAAIIHLNIKAILDADANQANMKDIIYNKVSPDNLAQCILVKQTQLSRESMNLILETHYSACKKEEKRAIEGFDSSEIDEAVRSCIQMQKDRYRIMEAENLEQITELKKELQAAKEESVYSKAKLERVEIEKSNLVVQLNALRTKYATTQIEFEDIQSKLEFLNNRASKRQMHYNKEYEEQLEELRNQIKNSKIDLNSQANFYKHLQVQFDTKLAEKDETIARLNQQITEVTSQQTRSNVKPLREEFATYSHPNQFSYNFQKNSRKSSNDGFDFLEMCKHPLHHQQYHHHVSQPTSSQSLNEVLDYSNRNQEEEEQQWQNQQQQSNADASGDQNEKDLKIFFANVPEDFGYSDLNTSMQTVIVKSSVPSSPVPMRQGEIVTKGHHFQRTNSINETTEGYQFNRQYKQSPGQVSNDIFQFDESATGVSKTYAQQFQQDINNMQPKKYVTMTNTQTSTQFLPSFDEVSYPKQPIMQSSQQQDEMHASKRNLIEKLSLKGNLFGSYQLSQSQNLSSMNNNNSSGKANSKPHDEIVEEEKSSQWKSPAVVTTQIANANSSGKKGSSQESQKFQNYHETLEMSIEKRKSPRSNHSSPNVQMFSNSKPNQ